MSNKEKQYDVVVWGATGFTGRLVCEYLLTHYGVSEKLSWAMAGRSESKLKALRTELVQWNSKAESIPILLGDSFDLGSLQAIAAQTKVVCTTVGPYLDYGSAMVETCINEGTDYCDLTGETPFIRKMMDTFHQAASDKGRRIVHCCGYDSIPSDLGCMLVQREAISRHGVPCQSVKLYVRKAKGGLSGGTMASMLGFVERAARDRGILSILGDPYSLNPKGTWRGPDGRDQQTVEWDEDVERWTGPFVMAGINTRVVRRSNWLLGLEYGEDFRYGEVSVVGKGMSGRVRGELMRMGLGLFTAAVAIKPSRWMLQKTVLPAPGEGPNRETRENGFFLFGVLGKGIDKEGKPFVVKGKVSGDKDPGYAGTAIMLGEAAVCLAQDGAELPDRYGIITPASAMGGVLMERLRAAGMVFDIVNDAAPERSSEG